MDKRRLVIIGGGFAGLNIVKNINRKKWQVVVIDRNNFHSFPPLFYQLASGGLDAGSICFALRREMRSRHARGAEYHMGDVQNIDIQNKTVSTQYEVIPYDKLVIAAGTTNNFFGMDKLREQVYTLKSVPEAIRCRNDIIGRLERAALETNPARQRAMLSFVIIGGGPTGVEIAGALGEMKRFLLPREYPTISADNFKVTLMEGSDRLLRTMSPDSSAQVKKDLNGLLVDVMTSTIMEDYDGKTIKTKDGKTIDASMVIWTAGVIGEPMSFSGAQPTMGPGQRLTVDEFNRVLGIEDVFAAGDIAYNTTDEYPHGLPQLAQVAIQGGANLAKNLNRGDDTSMWRPFRYNDKGSMATVGRNKAIVELKHMHMSGRSAWFVWMIVHLMSLLGMRNKITVFVTWIWAYCTYSASVRLLLRLTRYPLRDRENSIFPQ